jgi:hypothetical protein
MESSVSVFIKLLTGNVIKIVADLNDSIKLLKFKIKLSIGIPTYNQKLFLKETELVDSLHVRDYPIKDESVIHLFPRIRAGFF